MAIPPTVVPAFPNVPRVPGVPALSGPVRLQSNVVLLASDAANVISLFLGPQWGLFTQSGAPAFASLGIPGILGAGIGRLIGLGGQSVAEFEYRQDHRISTAPQEQGAFLSYNKVATPFNGRVSYIVSGISAQRQVFIEAVQSMQKSLTLLSLVMPEFTFPSVNVVHHDFRRTAKNGVSMFVVEVWVEEVRITGTAAYTSTATPAGANQVNGGSVQPQAPSPVQAKAVPPSWPGV